MMDSILLVGVLKLFVSCSLFICCDGATVEFFKEVNFKGEIFQTKSSSSCQSVPSGVTPYWSVKSTGCIAVFYNNDCTACDADLIDFVSKSETSGLGSLRQSYRDCTDLEKGPQVNLDYYAESLRGGQRVEFRDICTCTNLPSNVTSQSLNLYGNYFTFFKETNCHGSSSSVSDPVRYTFDSISSKMSFIPTEIPSHCLKKSELTAKLLKFEPVSDLSSIKLTKNLDKFYPSQIFVNNSTKPVERNYETMKNTSSIEIKLSDAFDQINTIDMENNTEFSLIVDSLDPFITMLEDQIRNSLALSFQSNIPSGPSNSTKLFIKNKHLETMMIVPPCTKYEVKPFGEIIENVAYPIRLQITGKRGSVKVRSEDIQKNITGFANLKNTDDYTLSADSTAKLKLNYAVDIQLNVTATPIPECMSQFLPISSQIFKIEQITDSSNLEDFVHQIFVEDKEIFINNGTSPQETNFEKLNHIAQKAQFEFSEELKRINLVSIEKDFWSNTPFLRAAWGDLRNGLPETYQNRQNLNEPVKFVTQSNKTFHLQKNINVQPCQKYEVSSFVEIAEDVEMEYRVQLRVIGKLGDDVVGVDVIRGNLEGLVFLANENNQTAVAEATIKLKSTFGVCSGVNAVGNPLPDCRSRFITFSANIVELERITSVTNETASLDRIIAIAPKQAFNNNGTTHQEEDYEAAKEVIESAEFLLSKEFDSIYSLKVGEEVKNELDKTIPFLASVWTKLTSGLFPNQSKLSKKTSFEVENKKEFRVQKTIAVAPCTSYEIDSFIQMTEGLEVNYRAVLEITGKLGSEKVLAEETRANLKDVAFISDKDDFTVMAETNMKLILNYGTSSGVNVEGKQMLDCLAIQAEIVENCKFVGSG